MKISMYQASVPIFERLLNALSAILDMAAEDCAKRSIEEAWMMQARLYPDMYSFSRQITRATDHARRGSATLARLDFQDVPETETSFADLKARIGGTLAFLGGIRPEQMEGSDEAEFSIIVARQPRMMNGLNYLQRQVLPQFFFHTTTAYDILRHNGVELGKRHFLMNI